MKHRTHLKVRFGDEIEMEIKRIGRTSQVLDQSEAAEAAEAATS